jgi:asparagine synthase (glutamine-hydrolysing)
MCGICGEFNFVTDTAVDPRDIKRMTDTLVHRGPDDEGQYVSGSIGLGFRRLSIIDLAGGHQPMSDAEATVHVVFNGEIYNFRELKAELQGCGHVFRTHSDTEVIVHGYKQWGNDVLDHLNGMFCGTRKKGSSC